MKILVVDDSSMTRIVTRKTLNTLGIKDVVEAEDGVVALSHFRQQQFDCVFTDWNMPNMDGLDLLKAIREINKDVPVIMVTTEGSRMKILQAIQVGVSDYLVKPFTPNALREKLSKWVAVPS